MRPIVSMDRDISSRLAEGVAEALGARRRIVVALSGGLDSTALLHLLRFAPPEEGFELAAAHFDHGMRVDSANDAAWVRGVCRAWGVPLIEGAAEPGSLRSEADARDARYGFLLSVRETTGADVVVTAHHAGDQAETVLFRAVRGSGLRGLSGIRRARGDGVVRPLLHATVDDLKSYAAGQRLRWRDDPSNLDTSLSRNAIRHTVLPDLVRSVAPGAVRSLAALAEQAAVWDEALTGLAEVSLDALTVHADEGRIVLDAARLSGLPESSRARVIRAACVRLGHALSRAGTRLAVEVSSPDSPTGGGDLGGGIRVSLQYEEFVLEAERSEASARALEVNADVDGRGQLVMGGHTIEASWTWTRGTMEGDADDSGDRNPAEMKASFGAATLSLPLSLRGWNPGDRITLPHGTTKMKALFQQSRIPRWRRTRQAVLADAGGRVLWAPGLRRSIIAPSSDGGRSLTVRIGRVEDGAAAR